MKDGYDYYSKPLSGTELRTMERNRSRLETTLKQMGKDPSLSYMVPMSTKPMTSTELSVLARNISMYETTRKQMNFDSNLDNYNDRTYQSNKNKQTGYISMSEYLKLFGFLIIGAVIIGAMFTILSGGFGWLERLMSYFVK